MQLNRHGSTASPTPPHSALHKPNTRGPTLWSQKATAGNTHCERNSTLDSCITQIQNLTTDEHSKHHPLKLFKSKVGEPLQMQKWPLFIAQICHNSRIIEKVHFGRSPHKMSHFQATINVILYLLYSMYFSNPQISRT